MTLVKIEMTKLLLCKVYFCDHETKQIELQFNFVTGVVKVADVCRMGRLRFQNY